MIAPVLSGFSCFSAKRSVLLDDLKIDNYLDDK